MGVSNSCSAACRFDHDVKGQGIYAFVTLNEGQEYGDGLKKELIGIVREQIGAFASPDVVHWAPGKWHDHIEI